MIGLGTTHSHEEVLNLGIHDALKDGSKGVPMRSIMEQFHVVDSIAVAFVVFWTLLGFKKGMRGQIAFVLSVVIIASSAFLGFKPCSTWIMQRYLLPFESARLLSLLATTAIPLTLILFARALSGPFLRERFTSCVDRPTGALMGFVSSSAFVLLVFVCMNVFPSSRHPAIFSAGSSWIGTHLIRIESNLGAAITLEVDRTQLFIQRARNERASREGKRDL